MVWVCMQTIKFIDLFAGIGGTRLGFEQACIAQGLAPQCVFTSEIKEYAIHAYKQNFNGCDVFGDITQMDEKEVPDFNFLLAGFPCQPFSFAGSRHGFNDIRGTLFFDIIRILKEKKPEGFLLENVEGLVNHDKINAADEYGQTLDIILKSLRALGYFVAYKVLNAADFGVPQNRKRIYILGSLSRAISLEGFSVKNSSLGDILESGQEKMQSEFVNKLLSHYAVSDLHGRSIKDKRGGRNNIHSWDFDLKGVVSEEQKIILSKLLRQRRQKRWAVQKGIQWMDGMPLSLDEIKTFHQSIYLEENLNDLVHKGYLKYEYPKEIVYERLENGRMKSKRVPATDKEKGYNIVVGKLSFEVSKILDPNDVTPTLVATDVTRLAVVDGDGLRKLSVREGLRLSGFPEWYTLNGVSYVESFDLLGNTVIVPVIDMVCQRYISEVISSQALVA